MQWSATACRLGAHFISLNGWKVLSLKKQFTSMTLNWSSIQNKHLQFTESAENTGYSAKQ